MYLTLVSEMQVKAFIAHVICHVHLYLVHKIQKNMVKTGSCQPESLSDCNGQSLHTDSSWIYSKDEN